MREGDRLPPIHAGEMLREEFTIPLDLAPKTLAEALGVPSGVIEEFVAERGSITGQLALRLERALGSSAEFWMNLQKGYELEVARDNAEIRTLEAIPRLEAAE